ncbi:hypothetical protein [Roseimicrobium gellanilyticum]|uniref:hypothetical protein n=1 Tax=Roseimicrobium gellanilyticum TaxID=748857 RepID=UPI001473747C|nr:hypothetical protein [Roseimicrobium gellanilyticum]
MKTWPFYILALASIATVSNAAPPAARNAQPGQPKKPAFVGGEANWLPKVKSLPTAQDIEATAQKLSSRVRTLDPFSVSTFPREEDVAVVDENENRPTVRLTLNQALQTLKLNGVNLVNKEFLIGGRNVFEGDVIELSYKNEIFQALCVEVNATEIVFRDLQRGDVGIMPHNMIPTLQLEPMRKVASSLESRWAPMEPATPPKK